MNYFAGVVLCLAFCNVQAEECFDSQKIMVIGKEFHERFKNINFCATPFNANKIEWITNVAFPQIMNQSFLGVEPPANWRELTKEVFTDCYTKGNLCVKSVHKEYAKCIQAKLPLVLLQLSPWMSDNCVKMNQAVVDHWPEKRSVVMNLINEYVRQFK